MEPPRTAIDEPSSRISLIEVVGYVGLTATLFATGLLLSLSELSQNLVGAVSLALTVVLLVVGAALGSDAPDRVRRLRSVCWYLSVSFFSAMLEAWLLSPSSLLSGFSSLLPIFVATAVYALALWIFLPRTLQQLAFYSAVLSAVIVLVAPSPASFVFAPPNLTGVAIVLWAGGAGWFALGYLGWARPPRSAMVIGMLASLPGPLLFAMDSTEAAFVLLGATAAVYLFLGGRLDDRAVSGIGAVGLVVGVVGFLVSAGVDDRASGGAVLALGAGLLVVTLLLARQDGGPRPVLGSPTFPLGPRAGAPVGAAAAPPEAPAMPPPPEPPPTEPTSEPPTEPLSEPPPAEAPPAGPSADEASP